MLMHKPVLYALNFQKPFKVAVDANDVGVLLQKDEQGVENPICYFSKKFKKCQKNYYTSEKELIALVLVLQHFEVYVSSKLVIHRVYRIYKPSGPHLGTTVIGLLGL